MADSIFNTSTFPTPPGPTISGRNPHPDNYPEHGPTSASPASPAPVVEGFCDPDLYEDMGETEDVDVPPMKDGATDRAPSYPSTGEKTPKETQSFKGTGQFVSGRPYAQQ
jgi:hypothetical protein